MAELTIFPANITASVLFLYHGATRVETLVVLYYRSSSPNREVDVPDTQRKLTRKTRDGDAQRSGPQGGLFGLPDLPGATPGAASPGTITKWDVDRRAGSTR
jgi:hypothetical protein